MNKPLWYFKSLFGVIRFTVFNCTCEFEKKYGYNKDDEALKDEDVVGAFKG